MTWTVTFDRDGEQCTLRSVSGSIESCSPIPPWTRLQVFGESTPDGYDVPAWSEWTRRHGLDLHRMPLPGWIAVDDTTLRVHADYYALNERGERYPSDDRTTAAREVFTVQLEGKALPFPGDEPLAGASRGTITPVNGGEALHVIWQE